jgi:hypothetical protein
MIERPSDSEGRFKPSESAGGHRPTPEPIAAASAPHEQRESTFQYSVSILLEPDSWVWALYAHSPAGRDMLDGGYAATETAALAAAGRALISVSDVLGM